MREFDKLSAETFTRFLGGQEIPTSGQVTIDLDGISFISPGGIVPLVAFCEDLSKKGQEIIIRASKRDFQSKLIKSGFFHAVEGIAVFDPLISPVLVGELESWRGANHLLIEISKLEDSEDLSRQLDKVLNTVRFRMGYAPHRAYDATSVVSEICQNAFDHNQDCAGFFALQLFGEMNRFIEICVSDNGIGLRRSLMNNPGNPTFDSDINAIKFALNDRISEFDDPTRGTGLCHLLRIVKKNGGSIQITSGSGTVRYRTDKDRWSAFPSFYVPGVSIALSFPANR